MAVDPLANHHEAAARVMPGRDPHAIKRMYVDLGADWWEAHADDLDAVPALSLPETLPVVAGLLEGVRGLLLDAGCGPNPMVSCALVATGGSDVVALDIGLGTVRTACAIGVRRGVRLRGVVGDVERLPFRAGAFDGVACDDTVEHLPDDGAGVGELLRVARRGAPVVVATPNRHNAYILRARLRDRLRGRRHPLEHYFVSSSHLREYTWPEVECLVGARTVVRARVGCGWERTSTRATARLASWLVRRSAARRFSSMIVVRADGIGA
ncbi:MAG: class I SAM-dependent methyltransferase [Acidimicrobiia bacterium]|jgi:SAM-dependent methyltransferase|nr:class I SAM-dependent methyltransferase [Acidimicrobiia bacterium]